MDLTGLQASSRIGYTQDHGRFAEVNLELRADRGKPELDHLLNTHGKILICQGVETGFEQQDGLFNPVRREVASFLDTEFPIELFHATELRMQPATQVYWVVQ